MDERLYAAAVRNDTDNLSQLLQEDITLLDSTNVKCEDKNALHIAAMLGNEALVRAILGANSSSSFYHMCLARDRYGKNPVHLAAMYGNLNILNLLTHHHGLIEAALAKTEGKGTILHLCVEHNQLEALKLLLAVFTDREFVCSKNEDGMSVLHLIKNTSAEMVNVKNANGKTALDLVLEHGGIEPDKFFAAKIRGRQSGLLSQSEKVDHQLLRSLKEARALTSLEAMSHQEKYTERVNLLENSKGALMVVATIVATIASQTMLSPPGGYWQDDVLKGKNQHRAGEAVMAQTHPNSFSALNGCTAVVFTLALFTVALLQASGLGIARRRLFLFFSSVVLWLSLMAIFIGYMLSLAMVAPKLVKK